jgi:ketosteroid isomerase-like protein
MLAVPAWAEGPSEATVRTTIEKFFTAFNSGDASAAEELWRADAVEINVMGMVSGEAKLNERLAAELKLGLKLEHKIDRVEVDGSVAWAVGPYTVTIPAKDGGNTQSNGVWLQVLKQEAGAWKLQARALPESIRRRRNKRAKGSISASAFWRAPPRRALG